MGQTTDQLRQEIEQKREDAASKIDQIESRVQDIPQMAKETVTDTVQQAKDTVTDTVQQAKETVTETVQNLDVRQQIEQRPLAALGVAVAGGFLLGGIMRGGKGSQQGGQGGQYQYQQGGMASGLRGVAKSSGLEETLSGVTGAVMGMLTERVRSTVQQNFPQVAERMQSQSSSRPQSMGSGQSGGGMLQASTGGGAGSSSSSPATTDATGRPATQFRG